MKNLTLQPPRPRIRYVSPRFQGPAVLAFAAIIATGGAIFWKLVDSKFQSVFPRAAIQGHYTFGSAYDIVRDLLSWHLAGLFFGIFLTGSVLALLIVVAIRHGIGKAVDSCGRRRMGTCPHPPARVPSASSPGSGKKSTSCAPTPSPPS